MASSTAIRRSVFGWTGRFAFRLVIYPVDLLLFIFHVLRDWVRHGHMRDPVMRRNVVVQILQSGGDPLPAVLLLGVVVGFTFALPLVMLLPQMAESELAPLLMQVIGLELSSLLTAVVLIGRSGRAMAIELANMKLHGEARGLERLGINLNDFFTAPRLIGAAAAQLILATYFTAAALFGGMLLASFIKQGKAASLALATLSAVETGDLLIFIAKNLAFGFIIAGAACYSALRVRIAATEVPERAQEAATNALLLVFIVNGLVTALTT